jgi:Holliday junction resolvase
MAVLINMAVIITMALVTGAIMIARMNSASLSAPGRRAEDIVAGLFDDHGWKVQREPVIGPYQADLLVKKGRQVFVVEVKALSEGRPDRAIPLLSQAILQAQAYARALGKGRPLAVVYVGDASLSLLKQVREFSKKFASEVAVGVISESGVQCFLGEGLERLSVEPRGIRQGLAKSPSRAPHIFSDLNQWMLKVLLAPEIPERLLAAPRAEYHNVSELARAANVSTMSAFRFAQRLREEGFLDELSPRFKLVRRAHLFDRWRAVGLRPSQEMPMRFLIRGSAPAQLHKAVSSRAACLALFAAAEALHLGHVKGVPPYVYVPKLPRLDQDAWKELVPCSPADPVDLILRQAASPQSVFRGAVRVDGVAVSDVLQVWLDVSAHPSRGEEQAELIHRKILRQIIEGAA